MSGFDDLFGAEIETPEDVRRTLDHVSPPHEAQPINPRVLRGDAPPTMDLGCASGSLVDSLGSLVDDARQIAVSLGERPYRVFLVRGKTSEDGRPEVVSEIEILPRPAVSFGGARKSLDPAGRRERGTVTISEISPRYTEDDLDPALQTGEFLFWEIQMDARDGLSRRRRLVLTNVPYRRVGDMDWYVSATLQEGARSRDGRLPDLPLYPGEVL